MEKFIILAHGIIHYYEDQFLINELLASFQLLLKYRKIVSIIWQASCNFHIAKHACKRDVPSTPTDEHIAIKHGNLILTQKQTFKSVVQK